MSKLPNLLQRSPIETIETALANLEARRQTLEGRLADAKARLDAARSARKGALESDPSADLSPLTRAVRDVEDEVSTLDGVLDDLAEQEEAQRIKLDRARDDSHRAVSAKQLQKIALSVDTASGDLEAAVGEVAKVIGRLVAALPPTLAVISINEDLPKGQTEHQRLAAIVLADALAAAMPWAFPIRYWANGNVGHTAVLKRHFDLTGLARSASSNPDALVPIPGTASATALITDRLRARAAEILAGNLAPEIDDVDVVAIERLKPPPPILSVEVFALENFAFRTEPRGFPYIVGRRWVHHVPEDAADAAVKAGVGMLTSTPEGARTFAEEKARREQSRNNSGFGLMTTLADCVDLGVIRQSRDVEEAA